MKKCFLFCLVLGCSDADRAVEVLRDEGFTNITTQGHAWWGCSDSDQYCTAFEAPGPSGRHVKGAVGCGIGCGKGCTVRIR